MVRILLMTLTAFLYCVDILRQSTSVAAESGASYCPTFESTYGMCISPTDTTADYETAKASCENLCSTLMFIKESSNHFTLMFYLAANGVTDSLWLGLSYNDSRGSTSDFSEFMWSDGEYVNFTVTDGNPGDVVGTCQGVALTPSGFGSWTRQGCETLSRYVCQRTLGNPPDTVCSHPTAISGGYSTPTYGLCSTGTNCCSVNTTVVFTCDPGYYVSGPTSVYCTSSGLLSTTVTSTCLPLPCPSISIPVENHVTVTSTSGSMTDTVTYICQNGYEMADSSTTLSNLCTWNYTQEAMAWTVEPPVCYGLPCPDLTIDHAGNYNCTGINGTMGDMVTCTCYPGYAYGSGSNTLVLTCTWVVSSTGWSTSLTSCAAQPCPPLINLITADHHVQIPDSSTVTVGQSAFVFCEGGYALNGETTQNITCSASGATSADWVGALTPCVALPCPAIELTPENHLVMANLSGSMGDRITFECETNYTLPGFVNTMVADCIWDGLSTAWSQPVPSCIAICASPTIPAENHVTGNVSAAIVGDRILYVCESGYAVQSGDLYLTSVSVGCVSDVHVGAVWETNPPVCIGLPCPPVLVTEWTHAQVTGNLTASRVGDKVDVACEPGYSLDDSVTTNYSIACIINDAQSGQWGQPLANCTPTPCPSVLAMSANGVEFNNSAAAFGDVVNFTCTPGYVHEDPAVTSVVVGCVLQNGSSTPSWEVDPPPCYGLPCPNMTFPNDVRQAGTSNVTSNDTSGPQWIADGRVGDTYTFHCVENIVFPDGSSEFTVACVWQGNGTGWNREVPSCRETNLLDSLNISALTSPSAIADALNGTLGSMSADSSNGTTNTEQLKELRDVLMTSLSSVLDTVSDEAGLVSVANLMSTVTDTTPDQLSDNAMDQAANMSTALLGHVASANLSTTAVTSLLTSIASTTGSLLNASLSAPSGNGTTSAADQAARAEKSGKLVDSMLDTMTSVLERSTNTDPIVISTPALALAVQKLQSGPASSLNLSTSSASVGVTGGLQLAAGTFAKVAANKFNPYRYSEGGSNITSQVTSINMQTGNGSAVNLGNSFVDFEIPVTLEFQETEANMENVTAQKGISQTIEISDGSQNLFQVIRPPSDRTTYFYGRRDGEATNSSYDFRVAINGASSSRKKRSTTASSQPDVNSTITVDVSQDSNGELSLYVPAEGLDGASSFNLLILADGVGSANGSSQKLTMKSTVINPRFYNAATKSWNSSSGLQVSKVTKEGKMIFKSNFFGSFAAGLFIPPNTIDFDKVFANFSSLLAQSPHVLIVMCSLFVLYFLILIWARRKDLQDNEKWEYKHLIENGRFDKGKYLLSVYTGSKSPARTTAKLFVVLYGKDGQSPPKVLMDGSRENFTRGAVNNFVFTSPEPLGKLTHLHIWHEEVSGNGDYFLEKVVVYDILRRERTHYFCDQWLSSSRGDNRTDRLMASADDEGLNDFNFLLSSNASKRLFDDHLWFSVAKRPTPSRLSRVQRLSICIVVLFLCMISNAMWFREEDDTTSGIQLGPIKITFRQVWVGLMSSVLVVPPTLIIMEVFKRSKPRNSCTTIFPYVRDSDENESKSTSADDGKFHSAVQKLITKEMQDKSKSKRADKGFEILVDLQMELEEEEKTKSKEKKIRKKPIRFPWWSVVFGYVLAFLAVATSAFFVLLYSLEWGPEKSTNWLISLFFSFSQSIILVQPLKVLLAAVLMACLLRMPGDEEEEEDMMIAEHKLQDVIPPKPHSIPVADKVIDLEDMRARKKARRRDQRLTGKLREIFIHLLYLCLLVLICFANRDRNFFRQNYNLRNSLDLTDDNFAKVQRIETIFSWLNDTIFPAVFPTENYNGDLYTEADDLAFIRDMRGLRLGPLRLRQQRVKKDSCNVVDPMNKFLNGCNPMISGGDMDKGAYGPGWVTTSSNSTSQLAQAFMFSPPNGPNDQTVYGQVDHYEGGGYMVEVSSANDSVHILTSLKDLNWIDRLTRAVIVEFTVNNANVNVFSMVRIIVELPAVGGIFIKKELVSFRPYPYVDPFDFVLLLVQVIWAVLVFVLLGMEVVKMVKLKKKYCQQLWHFIELGDLCLAITSMVCFVLRTVYTIRSVEDVKNNGGHFVGFDLVANWDNAYTVIIAIDLFLATLQLFRPLTFNKHLAIVQSALIRAFIAVTTYMVIFGILLFSYAQALQLIAGQVIAAFRALPYAMFNLFGVMLGVLKYSNIITSESLLVSIFFTAFTMTMNFIILNMFISIINDGLTEVKGNEELQDYDEELAEHVWSKMDAWIKAIFQRKDKSALGEPTQNEGSNSAKSSAKAPQVVITLAEEPVKQEGQERKKDPLIVKSEEGRALLVKANNQKLSVQKGRRARKLATANSLACLMEEKFLRVFHTYHKDETTREKWKRTIEEIRLKNHRQKIDKIGEKFVECRMHIHKLEQELQTILEEPNLMQSSTPQTKGTEEDLLEKSHNELLVSEELANMHQDVNRNSAMSTTGIGACANNTPGGITPNDPPPLALSQKNDGSTGESQTANGGADGLADVLQQGDTQLAHIETTDEVKPRKKSKKDKTKLKEAAKSIMLANDVIEQIDEIAGDEDDGEGKKKKKKKKKKKSKDNDADANDEEEMLDSSLTRLVVPGDTHMEIEDGAGDGQPSEKTHKKKKKKKKSKDEKDDEQA